MKLTLTTLSHATVVAAAFLLAVPAWSQQPADPAAAPAPAKTAEQIAKEQAQANEASIFNTATNCEALLAAKDADGSLKVSAEAIAKYRGKPVPGSKATLRLIESRSRAFCDKRQFTDAVKVFDDYAAGITDEKLKDDILKNKYSRNPWPNVFSVFSTLANPPADMTVDAEATYAFLDAIAADKNPYATWDKYFDAYDFFSRPGKGATAEFSQKVLEKFNALEKIREADSSPARKAKNTMIRVKLLQKAEEKAKEKTDLFPLYFSVLDEAEALWNTRVDAGFAAFDVVFDRNADGCVVDCNKILARIRQIENVSTQGHYVKRLVGCEQGLALRTRNLPRYVNAVDEFLKFGKYNGVTNDWADSKYSALFAVGRTDEACAFAKAHDQLGNYFSCMEIKDKAPEAIKYLKSILDRPLTDGEFSGLQKWAFQIIVKSADKATAIAVFDKYIGIMEKTDPKKNRGYIDFVWGSANNGEDLFYNANYEIGTRMFESMMRYDPTNGIRDVKMCRNGMHLYSRAGYADKAVATARYAVARFASKMKPADKYLFNYVADIIPMTKTVNPGQKAESLKGAVKAVSDKVAKAVAAECGEAVSGDAIVDGLNAAAREANALACSALAAAIIAYRDEIKVPLKNKTYDVFFSDATVTGYADVLALIKAGKVKTSRFDRKFGGNYDMLYTDVATGRGAVDKNAGKDANEYTELAAVCDAKALHLVYIQHSADARAVEGGKGRGGFECYIATGKNVPHTCFGPEIDGEMWFWDANYDSPDYKQFKLHKELLVTATGFTDDTIISYVSFPWMMFRSRFAPANGDAWQFEAVNWGAGGASWNGTDSVHGRSKFGALVFQMNDKQRTALLRNVIIKTAAAYKGSKNPGHNGGKGTVGFWRDPDAGDPEFYEKVLMPYVEKVEANLPLVKWNMSDTDVNKVAAESLAVWDCFQYTVDAMRYHYLLGE